MSNHSGIDVAKREREELRQLAASLYSWRRWWLDLTGALLWAGYFTQFITRAKVFWVPKPFAYFLWALLIAYFVIKQSVRFQGKISSRPGWIWVIMWWGEFMFMVIFMGFHPPDVYVLPDLMFETTLIVTLGFLGMLPFKRWFFRRYPTLAGLIVPHDEQK